MKTDRLKALLRAEGLRNLRSEVRQSSDETGECYLTHAQITAGDRVIIDLGPNPVAEGGDWSDGTLELLCEAVNHLPDLLAHIETLEAALNTPELHDFAAGVALEAAHQRQRWGADHDAGKAPEDWFWLLGYLGGKALHAAKAGDAEKALHHTISTAAALANWHAAILGVSTTMRPGIDPVARGLETEKDA